MVEAIQCPSCQTRYGLRPARVRTGLRRAQCYRCGDVFHIEAEVRRLLGQPEPVEVSEPVELGSPTSTANVPLAALAEAMQAPEAAAHDASAPTPALEAHDLALGDLELPEPGGAAAESAIAPSGSWPSPAETAPIPSMAAPVPLALPAPEPESGAAPELAPGPEEVTGSYSSARDAIARLFGDAPPAPSPTAKLRSALDMDAGMKALEDTLGGVRPESLSTAPFSAPAPAPAPEPQAAAPAMPDFPELPELPALPDLSEAPAATTAAEAVPMEASELPHASATMRMTAAEMLAAIERAAPAAAAPEPPEITQEEVTMVLPPPPSAPSPLAASDPSALRLRIGDQVYTGLDLPTIAKWIEEGRVLEEHQVARGMSENWMEVSKVPALRPVFERLRRGRSGGVELPPPPPSSIADTGTQKRGLFGGMFGKKD